MFFSTDLAGYMRLEVCLDRLDKSCHLFMLFVVKDPFTCVVFFVEVEFKLVSGNYMKVDLY